MSLPYREQRQLRGIEAGLFWSDSHLAGMLGMFGRLYHGQDMPASEQVPSGHGRGRRGVTRIAMAFAVTALALSILFSAAVALATSVRRARVRTSAAPPERTRPSREADGQQNPPG